MAAADGSLPERMLLYSGADPETVDAAALVGFLRGKLGALPVELRADFIAHHVEEMPEEARDRLARNLAEARVQQPDRRAPGQPLPGAVGYERRFLGTGRQKPSGLLYDGHLLMKAMAAQIDAAELSRGDCHVAVTAQLIGTWDSHNGRYHARAAVFGYPSLVSTAGLVHGPARPREHYIGRRLGLATSEPEDGQDFLRAGDPRLEEALKGYLLQAVFYHARGQAFCRDAACRLYNAHWQKDLLHAQTRPGAGLCALHRRMLEEMKCH